MPERGFAAYSLIHSLKYVGNRFKMGALLRGAEIQVDAEKATLVFRYPSHFERYIKEMQSEGVSKAVMKSFDFIFGVKVVEPIIREETTEELPW